MGLIVGMTFPKPEHTLGLEPSVLAVLPDGDNVIYSHDRREFDDADVELYLCSVYISGYDEFAAWARRHDQTKIVVGGYHPTTSPGDFRGLAGRVVQGTCDDIWGTLAQPGEVVRGVASHLRLPRRDLYDLALNEQVIPDKLPGEVAASISTSIGCPFRCDFCCTPLLAPRVESRPLDMVRREVEALRPARPDWLFIRDENFPLQPDWRERLEVIAALGARVYLFASANLLDEERIRFMRDHGVYMLCLGLEDVTIEYGKNKNLDRTCETMKKHGVMSYLSYIVDPLVVADQAGEERMFGRLAERFRQLAPEMVCGNFLMPFEGTALYARYAHLMHPEDRPLHDSKTAFLQRDLVKRARAEQMLFQGQWDYFTSAFYNEQVRRFAVGDTLHLRFLELRERFLGVSPSAPL